MKCFPESGILKIYITSPDTYHPRILSVGNPGVSLRGNVAGPCIVRRQKIFDVGCPCLANKKLLDGKEQS